MSFEVDIGYSSQRGPRELNEDFAGAVHAPSGDEARGLIAAIADGVSSGGHGREAAQTTVMGLLADYFATPATWEPTAALDRLIGAQNGWLADHNRRRQSKQDGGTALTTLTALVLHGQSYTLAHVGDTRAWRVRAGGGPAVPLTQDHAFDHPDMRSRLTRAIGLDDQVRVDYAQGDVRVGDCFVLSSDGVHGVLKPQQVAALALQGDAEAASEALVHAALDAGTRDNATALVIRVVGLDARQLDDELGDGRRLAPPPALKVGDVLDGYAITALVADTGVHLLYQARHPQTRELVALRRCIPRVPAIRRNARCWRTRRGWGCASEVLAAVVSFVCTSVPRTRARCTSCSTGMAGARWSSCARRTRAARWPRWWPPASS